MRPFPVPPLVVRLIEDYWGILLLLVAWEAWVIANSFNPIVMPTPTAVLGDLVANPGIYLSNVGITLAIAVFGLVAGMLVGTGLAVAAWFSPIDSGLLNPGFKNQVTAFQLNPFVKYRGLEVFGIFGSVRASYDGASRGGAYDAKTPGAIGTATEVKIDQAFVAAASGRPGPAVLLLPADLLREPCELPKTVRTRSFGSAVFGSAPSTDRSSATVVAGGAAK